MSSVPFNASGSKWYFSRFEFQVTHSNIDWNKNGSNFFHNCAGTIVFEQSFKKKKNMVL